MIIDTHVHYNLEPLSQDWQAHWKKAKISGVNKSIIVGTSIESTQVALEQSQSDKNLFVSVGIHPITVSEKSTLINVANLARELDQLLESSKVVAVGECGLDYYRLADTGDAREAIITHQKHLFISQIELALEHKLPLICHIRDKTTPEKQKHGNAYWDALEILQDFQVKQFTLHCASGPLSYIKEAIDLGGYMGFDGNITYPKAQEIREIFNHTPSSRRLLETDAPYLPPIPFRGKICEPWMISKTVEYVEQELKVSPEQFVDNTLSLFSLIK